MNENQIASVVLEKAFRIHTNLGPGLLESAYEKAMAHELAKAGLHVQRQKTVNLIYDGIDLGEAVRLDLLVNNLIVVELKSVEQIAPVHGKQVLTQLKLTGLKLGLLINFGALRLKQGIERVINGTLEP